MYNYISQTEHHKQTRGSGHHLDCSLYNSFHTLPNWQSNCLWMVHLNFRFYGKSCWWFWNVVN